MPQSAEGIGVFRTALRNFPAGHLCAAPVYPVLTDDYMPVHGRQTLRTAIATAASVLVVFALLGGTVFQTCGITINAFRIAGGIIVFAIGMDVLRAQRSVVRSRKKKRPRRGA